MKVGEVNKENVKKIADTGYIKLYDLNYRNDDHYYFVSRKDENNLAIKKNAKQLTECIPDGVGCILIVNGKLYLNCEYRLPIGQYTLSVPAGLIENQEDIFTAAKREIKEETGLEVSKIEMACPLMFSSPGLTDESNAMVIAYCDDITKANQNNCEDSECFNGYLLMEPEEIRNILNKTCADNYNFYSVYTVIAMLYYLTLK